MTDLFRRESLDHANRRMAGDVILASSVSLRVLSAFLVAVVIAGLTFISLATYARKETVTGWLTPDRGMIRLTSRQTGILETVLVQEGDLVTAGQSVATIRLSERVEQGDTYAILTDSLNAQAAASRTGSQAELEGLRQEQQLLAEREQVLRRELAEAGRRVELQRERLALAAAEAERAETLVAQGVLPRRRTEELRTAQLIAEQQMSEFSAAGLSIERQIGETRARLLAIPNEISAAGARQLAARATLDQQQTQAAQQGATVITASVSGRISALPVQPGQTVPAGAAVAVVTPRDSTLEAELYVPSRASGFVREGQEVRLMYQAFPYQKFGAGSGRVQSISRTVLAPSELAIPGMRVEEPVFRVRVDLASEEVSAYGEQLALQPGMLVTADVVIDRRSLIEWLFDPLFAAGRR